MITAKSLSKRYGDHLAVDDVSFHCAPGRVVGFLGPNGAGKSTTLRMICGLTVPTSGAATVLGRSYRQLGNAGRHTGVLLDASAQHGGRTGREALTLDALTMGLPLRRVDDMLALVGLTAKESRRRMRDYSLGMRQRLGLAHAMLGDPPILILDEPANGLDPSGIHWMRTLLRDHASRGGSVLLSSHLLREVEVVADDLVFILGGRIVACGPKTDLLADLTADAGTFARSRKDDVLVAALRSSGLDVQVEPGGGLRTSGSPEQVGCAALASGVVLTELRPAQTSGLEDLFLSLTEADAREDVTQ